MARVISFSRVFPVYHPKAGQPTYFVEKFYKSLGISNDDQERNFNPRLYHSDDQIMKQIALNDGLSLGELLQWFKYQNEFDGQIICWNKDVKY